MPPIRLPFTARKRWASLRTSRRRRRTSPSGMRFAALAGIRASARSISTCTRPRRVRKFEWPAWIRFWRAWAGSRMTSPREATEGDESIPPFAKVAKEVEWELKFLVGGVLELPCAGFRPHPTRPYATAMLPFASHGSALLRQLRFRNSNAMYNLASRHVQSEIEYRQSKTSIAFISSRSDLSWKASPKNSLKFAARTISRSASAAIISRAGSGTSHSGAFTAACAPSDG
mmetsp:Transcript_14672/g.55515  ORF Transcript_14672/g.55515 Transcript_14672/m.55515 type:complete len:230 (+) Transcript_14672:4105-4794(+)